MSSKTKTDWRSAVDPKSGREYFYNKTTKESTWTKPYDLATDAERTEMERKKRETAEFFKDMEKNIYRTMTSHRENKTEENSFVEFNNEDMYEYCDDDSFGGHVDNMVRNSVDFYRDGNNFDDLNDPGTLKRRGSIGGIRLVRTISSIDDDIMEMMKRSRSINGLSDVESKLEAARSYGSPSSSLFEDLRRGVLSPTSGIALAAGSKNTAHSPVVRQSSKESSLPQAGSKSKTVTIPTPAPTRKRRNSTGTLYIDSTMSQQDNKATMRCVCAVIRTHMVDAEKENIVPRPQFDIFKDEYFVKLEKKQKQQAKKTQHTASPSMGLCAADRQLPSLSTIVSFFENAFSKSQMENECIIMSLIYIERLIKVTKGRFCIRFDNWRSTSFACMIMASKVWDDLSMWNVDFSQISESFDLQRINELELAMLDALNYEVKVPAGEYAKYYFHLRSMIARLGYHRKRESELLPLNVEGARRLQLATEEYALTKMMGSIDMLSADSKGENRNRSITMHIDTTTMVSSTDSEIASVTGKIQRYKSAESTMTAEHQKARAVVLEDLLHATHIHGDGENTTEKTHNVAAAAAAAKKRNSGSSTTLKPRRDSSNKK